MADVVALLILGFKLVVYITYFLPVLGARVLEALGLWPGWWPFSGVM